MKKLLSSFLILFSILLALVSCDVDTSDNGQLEGYWQLARVDSLMGNHGSCDMRPTRRFWSFQHDLLQVSEQTYLRDFYLFRFTWTGNVLCLFNPYVLDRTSADRPVSESDVGLLYPYGIHGLDQRFLVMHIDDTHMQLRSDSLILYFNHY